MSDKPELMQSEQARLRASLLDYSYTQTLAVVLGSGTCALILSLLARDDVSRPAFLAWIAGHALFTLIALIGYFGYRNGKLNRAPELARRGRHVGAAMLGLLWAAGGLLWPMASGEIGIAMLICTAGLAAGGSGTSAGDPIGHIIFCSLAFVPRIVVEFTDTWWLSCLITFLLISLSLLALRNHHVLRTSLALRFENLQLLERVQAEHRLALLEKQRAEAAVSARTRFLAAASHDLRQPVQALSLFAEALMLTPDAAKRQEAIAAVDRTSRALAAMLESLLDLSKLDAGIVAPIPRPSSIKAVLEDIAQGLQAEAEARNMVVSVAGKDCLVWADRTMLQRVVQNLAVNAVRHGGGRVLLTSRVRAGNCLFQVWDQGQGIAQKDQERIFEELVQLNNQQRERSKGLGLGLAMVRRLCQLNGWRLTLRSEIDRGTVFCVELPLATEPDLHGAPKFSASIRDLTVLLVEDDQDVREAMSTWLCLQGATVLEAPNADEALAAWKVQRAAQGKVPDLLVTDFGLAGSATGADLAMQLRREAPSLPVVVVTGADASALGALPSQALTILQKPVKGESLWQAIEDVLQQASGERKEGTFRA